MTHVYLKKCIERVRDEGFETEAAEAEKELKVLVDDALPYRDLLSTLKLERHQGVMFNYITPLQGRLAHALNCITHLVLINSVHDKDGCMTCRMINTFITTGKFLEGK